MDRRTDAGPSGQKELPTGDTVIDGAHEYEAEIVRRSEEQSAGLRAPGESVTGDEAVISPERSQLAGATRPDGAGEGIKRQRTMSSSVISEGSFQTVVEALGNYREPVGQAARSGESDPAYQDGDAAQGNEASGDAGGGAVAGPSSGPTRDAVIDIDGFQDSRSAPALPSKLDPSNRAFLPGVVRTPLEQPVPGKALHRLASGKQVASAGDHRDPVAASSSSNRSAGEGLRAYWDRLKRTVGDVDWERYFSPSEAPMGGGNGYVVKFINSTGKWEHCNSMSRFGQPSLAYLGFNVGLVSILRLGALLDIDPEFFRDSIMNRIREGPMISSSESGIWCHLNFMRWTPFLSSTTPLEQITRDNTFLSLYWSKRGTHPRPVLALIWNLNVTELEEMKRQNFIQRIAWESYKKVLSNAFESREAATTFTTLALEADSHRRPSVAPSRDIAHYLLVSDSASELFPTGREPLRLARFIMNWLDGQVRFDAESSLSHVDVASLYRSPTRASLDSLCCSMNLEIWQYSTALLEQEAVGFADQTLLEPTFTTFRSLNQCRQLVNRMVSIEHSSDHPFSLLRLSDQRTLSETENIRRKLADLESRLKETFALLVQAVTVIDSDASKKAASQATSLTLFAALYLPATLATGIFGMNVKLFTDDSNAADWRSVIYTLMFVSVPSLAFFAYVFLPKRDKQSTRRGGMKGMFWDLID